MGPHAAGARARGKRRALSVIQAAAGEETGEAKEEKFPVIKIPPLRTHGIEIPEIEAKRKELNDNRRALRQAEAKLRQLEAQRQQARQEDTRLAVAAKRKGEKDPGDKNTARVDKEIEKASREVAILQELERQLEQEAGELLADHAAEIRSGLMETLEDLNNSQLLAINRLEESRSQRLQLSNALTQVMGALPPEAAPVPTEGHHTFEVLAHESSQSIMRVDETQIQRVISRLRAEAGDTGQLQEIAAMEYQPDDVFYPCAAGMGRPEGLKYFQQRQAERAAEMNGSG
jgi:hypothetical protein